MISIRKFSCSLETMLQARSWLDRLTTNGKEPPQKLIILPFVLSLSKDKRRIAIQSVEGEGVSRREKGN